jgi:hypothetical protein
LVAIQNEIGSEFDIVQPHRIFIKRGSMLKKCRSHDKAYEFLLFNDLLIYGTPSGSTFHVNRSLPIDAEFSIDDLPDVQATKNSSAQYRFQIVNRVKSFICYTHDRNVKFEWLLELTSIINSLQSKGSTIQIQKPVAVSVDTSSAQNQSQNSAKPIWLSDNTSPNCLVCKHSFSFLNRRHHCRKWFVFLIAILFCTHLSFSFKFIHR